MLLGFRQRLKPGSNRTRWRVGCPALAGMEEATPLGPADGKGARRAATGECVEAVEEKKGGAERATAH